MHAAINLPTSESREEIVPTWAISSEVLTSFLTFLSSSITKLTAFSIPRRMANTSAEFRNSFQCAKIAWAKTVAVVVPSPATSLVFSATSLINDAPTFWHKSNFDDVGQFIDAFHNFLPRLV